MAVARSLLLQALLAELVVVRSHFVTSLHTNYVVSLDFDHAAAPPALAEDGRPSGDVKVMAFAGGKSNFRCTLPGRGKAFASSSAAPGGGAAGGASAASKQAAREGDVAKSKEHFLNAKLATWNGSCQKLTKDGWEYEVCFGRRITAYRRADDQRISLGQHDPEQDRLLPKGGVRQMYVSGTDNRTSEVIFSCGIFDPEKKLSVFQEPGHYYTWTLSGPQFCDWRELGGAQARDAEGEPVSVSALLEALRGSCLNVTQGWWTYEYCFPTGLTQFHLQGRTRDPEYSLGNLVGEQAPGAVAAEMVGLKPSISPRERRSPPSSHRTLKQRLEGGTVCDETKRPRATTMFFQCPANWQTKPLTHIASISEGALCDYEVIVHTTLLCGHSKFLPTMPRGKETIQCVTEPPAPAPSAPPSASSSSTARIAGASEEL